MITDEEFLQALCPPPEAVGVTFSIPREIREAMGLRDDQLLGSLVPPELRLIQEAWSPSRTLRGWGATRLRQMTLLHFNDDSTLHDRLLRIPVGIAMTHELNGLAARAPSGRSVIVLDSGVVFPLIYLLRSYWSLSTWHSNDPLCRDHSADDFAQAILHLAGHTGCKLDFDSLDKMPTYVCRISFEHQRRLAEYTIAGRIFLLLHEYAHVALDHLHSRSTQPFRFTRAGDVDVYRMNHGQEYDADKFALEHIRPADKLRPQFPFLFFAWVIGILLRYFDLCEAVADRAGIRLAQSHPPAISRWEIIKKLID
jgi:hypothetical protein